MWQVLDPSPAVANQVLASDNLTCSMTTFEHLPFLAVDLAASHTIESVAIFFTREHGKVI